MISISKLTENFVGLDKKIILGMFFRMNLWNFETSSKFSVEENF